MPRQPGFGNGLHRVMRAFCLCRIELNMAENSTEKQEIIEFPCRFPLKVMGERHDEFVLTMTEVVRVHAPDLAEHDVTLRESSGGRFYALTITVNATSRQQLDNIYLSLTGHPMVKMVL